MPWDAKSSMRLKEEFIQKVKINSHSISHLCREFGVSRKTAYKWLNRYKEEGLLGLEERSRRPSQVIVTDSKSVDLILKARNKFPAWGGRKLRQYLLNEGEKDIPSEATFNRTLKKHGLISRESSEKREHYIRFEHQNPNDLWQMDFKGHFKLEEGSCHPLTIIDDHSRFAICLQAYLSEDEVSVRTALINAFRSYGLPEAMTMDNGSPWRGSYPFRFSRLTIWLMRLGVKISHSRPGHPQTQGKDERFHRSLKEEVLHFYQFKGLQDIQKRFDEWRQIYNNVRPHEGIGMSRPIDRYKPSLRQYKESLPDIEYQERDDIRIVQRNGVIDFKGKSFFIGEHLYGERVAVRPTTEDGKYDVYFSRTRLNRINLRLSDT